MDNVLRIFFNGSTYGGNLGLSLVNYILIIITLMPFFVSEFKLLVPKWKTILLFSFLVQAILWSALHAQGVSVVWNAIAGVLATALFREKNKIKKQSILIGLAAIAAALAADIYYGFIYPAITTYAHIAAIVLGLFLYFLYFPKKKID